jgi:hypothetical protein
MFKTVLAATTLAASTLSAHAVTLVQWDFESVTAPAASSTWSGVAASTGTGTASGVHAGTATWSTPAGNGSTKSFSGNTWAVNDYWQFAFSTVGYTGLAVSFDQTGSNTGPRDFAVAYSTNGSTFTTFASYALTNVTWSTGTPASGSSFTFDLSSITALNNAATVYIRLVDTSTVSINAGTVAAGGTNRVDNFTILATPVPEAGTAAMLAAGLATLAFLLKRRTA